MNWELLSLWGSFFFGILAVICLVLWGVGGQKSAPLRIAGGLCLLVCMASFAYMTYGV